ncbi:hypothetical protein MWU59_00135 [Flavobacteriaceae bacterium F08102]|nr:hypothetical protein [Flavobacteriaceae bacterium F08102]
MELRVELVNYTEEINKLVEKEKILSRLFIVNPSSMVRVYNEFGCNGQLLGIMPFTSLNDSSMIASICGENGEGSYKYIEGAQNCIDMTCHSRPGEEH